MASNLQDTLQRVVNKSEILIEKYRALLEEKRRVEAANESLSSKNEALEKEIDRLRRENEYLRLARTISSTPEQTEANRARISKLVRDIDKCISQLTD